MGFLCGLFLGKRARDLWRRGGCAEARVRKCFWSKVKRNCITWPSWSSTWATTLTTVVDHKFVTVEKKKKRKKVKMPKTWVVAKDMPVTVLWNYDLFAAEGHWSWPFPEACCLPRSQDRRVYIYMYVRSRSRFWLSWSKKNSRWYSTVGIFSRWLTSGCLRRFEKIRTVQDL